MTPPPPFMTKREVRDDRTVYRIEGELPLLWAERIATAAASEGLNVESLVGRHDARSWSGTVTIVGDARLDVMKVIQDGNESALGRTHEIDGFHVTRLPDGWISLTVSGADEPGFLASLLRNLRQLTLFPIALDVAAEQGLAIDTFELSSIGGSVPADGTENALVSMLSRITRPKTDAVSG